MFITKYKKVSKLFVILAAFSLAILSLPVVTSSTVAPANAANFEPCPAGQVIVGFVVSADAPDTYKPICKASSEADRVKVTIPVDNGCLPATLDKHNRAKPVHGIMTAANAHDTQWLIPTDHHNTGLYATYYWYDSNGGNWGKPNNSWGNTDRSNASNRNYFIGNRWTPTILSTAQNNAAKLGDWVRTYFTNADPTHNYYQKHALDGGFKDFERCAGTYDPAVSGAVGLTWQGDVNLWAGGTHQGTSRACGSNPDGTWVPPNFHDMCGTYGNRHFTAGVKREPTTVICDGGNCCPPGKTCGEGVEVQPNPECTPQHPENCAKQRPAPTPVSAKQAVFADWDITTGTTVSRELLLENGGTLQQNNSYVTLRNISGLPNGIVVTNGNGSGTVDNSGMDKRTLKLALGGSVLRPGVYPVTVEYASIGYPDSVLTARFNIIVRDATAPVLDELPNRTVLSESSVSPRPKTVIPFSFSDNSNLRGGKIERVESVTGLPTGFTWSQSGITGTASPDSINKTYTVTVTVSDNADSEQNVDSAWLPPNGTKPRGTEMANMSFRYSKANRTSKTFTITVKDGTEPSIEHTVFDGKTKRVEDSTTDANATNANRRVSFQLGAKDNSGAKPTVKFTGRGLPTGLSYDPDTDSITGWLDPDAAKVPAWDFGITVSDAAGNSRDYNAVFNISDGTEPVFTVNDQLVHLGDDYSYAVEHSDNLDTTPVGILRGEAPAGLAWSSANWALSGKIGALLLGNGGKHIVTLYGKDNAGNVSNDKSFTLTVVDVTPPMIDGSHESGGSWVIDDDTTDTMTEYSRQITASDDSGAIAGYSMVGLPKGLTYDHSTGLISGKAESLGVFPITITATDTAGNVSKETSFNLTVLDKTPPVITSEGGDNCITGSECVVNINATDNSGLPPTIRVTKPESLPKGLYFDAKGHISGTPTKAGKYTIPIEAMDASGNVTRAEITINVAAPKPKPTPNHTYTTEPSGNVVPVKTEEVAQPSNLAKTGMQAALFGLVALSLFTSGAVIVLMKRKIAGETR